MDALTTDKGDHSLEAKFQSFLRSYRDDIAWNGEAIARYTLDYTPVATGRILDSMAGIPSLIDLPGSNQAGSLADQLSTWLTSAPPSQRERANLALNRPPPGIHYVPGKYPIYYDFENSDITLDEILKAGASIRGRLLDFGCSSGRNLAVLKRAYGGELELHGVDPSRPSIEWLRNNLPGVQAEVSRQNPPLPYADGVFDLVIAKSIWTHFSPDAARMWFAEIARVMASGGHFFFSTHGPHDVAYRLVYDVPRPKYERFAGHPCWTRDIFLAAVIDGFEGEGHFFQPYKDVAHQGDIRGIDSATTADWGLMFMLGDYVASLLPPSLTIVRRSVGRTGNRHDAYVVRKAESLDGTGVSALAGF